MKNFEGMDLLRKVCDSYENFESYGFFCYRHFNVVTIAIYYL